MLVLTRKLNEAVVIGNNIVVEVLRSSNGHMQLGITAPRDISVHREEVFERLNGYSPRILADFENEGGQ